MFCLKFQGVQVRFAKKKLKFSLISEQISVLLKVAFHSSRNETLLIRCGHFASRSQELPVQAQSFTLSRHLTSPLRARRRSSVPQRSALNLRRCEQPSGRRISAACFSKPWRLRKITDAGICRYSILRFDTISGLRLGKVSLCDL